MINEPIQKVLQRHVDNCQGMVELYTRQGDTNSRLVYEGMVAGLKRAIEVAEYRQNEWEKERPKYFQFDHQQTEYGTRTGRWCGQLNTTEILKADVVVTTNGEVLKNRDNHNILVVEPKHDGRLRLISYGMGQGKPLTSIFATDIAAVERRLINAYHSAPRDIYKQRAVRMFKVPYAKVSVTQRMLAKMDLFGFLYGRGSI